MKSYAKVNVFLKITGTRGNYHEIVSRFVLVKSLYDEIIFSPHQATEFTLEGNFGCNTQSNTIYKAYQALLVATKSQAVQDFFTNHKIVVTKKIPEFAGLGGGSSNAATFLLMANESLKLGLSKEELGAIGLTVGADVPFFIYEYSSANVYGIGERVEKFEEEALDFEVITPPIKCDTKEVYTRFRNMYLDKVDFTFANSLLEQKSFAIMKNYSNTALNDLFLSATSLYPELGNYAKDGWFFSGSGSSFFRPIGG